VQQSNLLPVLPSSIAAHSIAAFRDRRHFQLGESEIAHFLILGRGKTANWQRCKLAKAARWQRRNW
jgi:hypothetical protein